MDFPETNVMLSSVADMPGTLAVKIMDQGDVGGALWQLKSDSQALQMVVKRLLEV